MDELTRARRLLRSARRIFVLTGAGVSAESGIAPFRGRGGIWSRYDPMEYATIEALERDPGKVWRMLYDLGREIDAAEPNAAHRALAALETRGFVHVAIATQNVDGLHQRAGSRRVVELHGSGRELWCMACRRRTPAADLKVSPVELPPRCPCGGVLRPDVTLFGEQLPHGAYEAAAAEAVRADVGLVVGTSAEVAPASWLPGIAKERGASLVEVNPEETWLTSEVTDVLVKGPAGEVVPALLAELLGA